MIRRADLDCRRQIEDDALVMARTRMSPSLLHSVAELDRKVGLGLRECLWAVLVSESTARSGSYLVRQLADEFGVMHRQLNRLLLGIAEDHFAEERRCGVIHVDDDVFATLNRLNGSPDEIFPRRSEHLKRTSSYARMGVTHTHLQPHIVWNKTLFNQRSNKVEVGVAGSGVGHLDLLDPAFNEQLEEHCLLLDSHRVRQRLVPISEVGGQPNGWYLVDFVWPLAVGKRQRLVGPVLLGGVGTECGSLSALPMELQPTCSQHRHGG
jgi:hypothetical protein